MGDTRNIQKFLKEVDAFVMAPDVFTPARAYKDMFICENTLIVFAKGALKYKFLSLKGGILGRCWVAYGVWLHGEGACAHEGRKFF